MIKLLIKTTLSWYQRYKNANIFRNITNAERPAAKLKMKTITAQDIDMEHKPRQKPRQTVYIDISNL